MNKDQITGLVLAGGRGRRMGNVDKGLQPFKGEPLALHVARRLTPQVGSVAFNANRNLKRYRAFGYPVWHDAIEGFHGPLAGVHAGLIHCETPWLACVPCDSPFLPVDLVERLAAAAEAAGANAAISASREAGVVQRQPVFCLLRTSLADPLARYLREGGRRLDTWFASCRLVQVEFEDEAAFRNINTLEELRDYES